MGNSFFVSRLTISISLLLFLVTVLFSMSGCKNKTITEKEFKELLPEGSDYLPGGADDLLVVDCLLPPKIKMLGSKMTYLEPRRPIKTTLRDCKRRGGECSVDDQTMALKVWLPSAKEGGLEAQTYVGEIYEKGLGVEPNYESAATWYKKAADKGYSRAQVNLGNLYERGLGVEKNMDKAKEWYRKATGLSDTIFVDPLIEHEQDKLKNGIQEMRHEKELLQKQLDQVIMQLEQVQQELGKGKKGTKSKGMDLFLQKVEDQKMYAKNLEKELKQRDKLLGQQTGEIRLLKDQLSNLEMKSIDFEQTRQQLDNTKQELNIKIKEAEDERARFVMMRKKLEQNQHKLIGEIEKAENEKINLEKSFNELKKQKQEAEIAGDQIALKQLEEQIDRRDLELKRQKEEIKILKNDVAKLDNKAEELDKTKEQLERTEDKLDNLKKVAEAERKEYAKTLKEFKDSKQKIAEAEKAIIELKKNRQTLKEQKEQAEVQIKRLTTQLEQSKKQAPEVALLNKEVIKFKTRIRELTDEISRLKDKKEVVKKPTIPQFPCKMFGNFFALIIANFKYEEWGDLETPENDAEKIKKILNTKYNFVKVKVVHNATESMIVSAFKSYQKKLDKEDNLLIYYAGHGKLDKEINKGYWIPVDGKKDEDDKWIELSRINSYMGQIKARHILVVADSCYSGRLAQNSIMDISYIIDNETAKKTWLQEMAGRYSRTILTSGDLHPVADIGGSGHSIFAKYFIKVLNENNTILPIKNLYADIQPPIFNDARKYRLTQNPQYQPIRFAKHESGEFFFCPRKK